MIQAKLMLYLIAVVAILGLLFGLYRYGYSNGVDTERVKWEKTLTEANRAYTESLERQQTVIAELTTSIDRLRTSSRQKREDYSNALQNDKDSKDWADTAIPDRVRNILNSERMPDTTTKSN